MQPRLTKILAVLPLLFLSASAIGQVSFSLIWSNAIGTQPYLTRSSSANTPFQRCLGYSAPSNQLILINRTFDSGATDQLATCGLSINVLDPATGVKLYQMQTNGISDVTVENIVLIMLGVADDGAVYAGSVSV